MAAILLSADQADYLTSTTYLPARLHAAATAGATPGHGRTLDLDEATAEALLSAFTARLATAGFDDYDEPTAEGLVLEDLVDALLEL